MKHVIQGIEITAKKDKFCLFSAIQDIMANSNIILSDSDIFVLCNGLNMSYDSDLNFIGYAGLDEIVLNLSKSNLFKVNLCYKLSSKEEMFEKSIEPILEDNIVLLFVGTNGLSYSNVFNDLSDENRGHTIILYGIDTDSNVAYIGDAYFRDSAGQMLKYMGSTNLEDIKNSIFGAAWFEIKEQNTIIDKKNILKLAICNLEEFLMGKEVDNRFYGNEAIKRFLKDFEKLNELNDDEFKQTCINIHFNIKVRCILIIFDFMISFLEENSSFQKEGYDVLMERIKFARKEWEKVGLNVIKAGKTGRKQMIPMIIEMCNKNLESQDEIFKDYLMYLKKI